MLTFDIGLDPVLYDFLTKAILSLLIGILIGIEREHRRKDQEVFAGVRTFAIVCLSGMLAAYVPDERLLFNADLYSPNRALQFPLWQSELMQAVRFHDLDVARHVGGHGQGFQDTER